MLHKLITLLGVHSHPQILLSGTGERMVWRVDATSYWAVSHQRLKLISVCKGNIYLKELSSLFDPVPVKLAALNQVQILPFTTLMAIEIITTNTQMEINLNTPYMSLHLAIDISIPLPPILSQTSTYLAHVGRLA